jgi:putative heme-binding domain-containing protein
VDEALSPDRQLVLDRYWAALQLARDASRGQAVFERQCSKCHKLGGQGYQVGPDLLTARTRADETIVSDILDPSNQITVGYNTYNVITTSGRIFSGVLVSEAATSITLRAEQDKDTVILRQEIDEMVTSTISMMPEKLEQEVSPQDVADLLAFLRQSLAAPSPSVLVLFDDDPRFPAMLAEGDGVARLVTDDRYRGFASLAIRPPQRFSAALPGWQYRIAENPGPGEYRYLRFAWKQTDGNGVMIELAADGQWPASDVPRQRYYSGQNATPWQATCVSPDRPTQWTVVTRDLWQDVGSFTLTGIAPTAFGAEALFDNIQLFRALEDVPAENASGQDSGPHGN